MLFEWHSLDHIGLDESQLAGAEEARRMPFDYVHLNSVGVDDDGDLLVSARHTWAIYKVDRATGAVRWRLGGKNSDFALDERRAVRLPARRPPAARRRDHAVRQRRRRRRQHAQGLARLALELDTGAKTARVADAAGASRAPALGQPGQRAEPRGTATSSSAGGHSLRSRSSPPTGASCSTGGSRRATTTTAPTASGGPAGRRPSRRWRPSARAPARCACTRAGTARPRSRAGRCWPATAPDSLRPVGGAAHRGLRDRGRRPGRRALLRGPGARFRRTGAGPLCGDHPRLIDPSSRIVHRGLWATSQGWPSGSRNTPE